MDDDELNVSSQFHFDSDGRLVHGPKPIVGPIWSAAPRSYVHPHRLTPSGDHTHTVKPPSAFMSEVLRQQAAQTVTLPDIYGAAPYGVSSRAPYVNGDVRNLLTEAILDMGRLVHVLTGSKALTEEAILKIAKRWKIPVEQQIPYTTFCCDDCGEELPSYKAYPVGSLPIPVSSAGVGQSATLCQDCFEEVEPHIPKGAVNGNV